MAWTKTHPTDTIVCGIDHHRVWLLQIVTCDCVTGTRKDFMWFFNTRAEAENRLEQLVSGETNCNMIVKIIKVRAFEHFEFGFEQIEKEN